MEDRSFAELVPGSVRCAFAPQVRAAGAALQDALLQSDRSTRLVTHWCSDLPALEALLKALVNSLAEAARLLWPDWYDGALRLAGDAGGRAGAMEQQTSDLLQARRLASERPNVNAQWLHAAIAACRTRGSLLLPQFPLAMQARQLGAALAQDDLVLVAGLEETAPSAERLLGFSRALEWLAHHAHAAVIALLPESMSHRRELDAIAFRTIDAPPVVSSLSSSLAPALPKRLDAVVPAGFTGFAAAQDDEGDERKSIICPILGRPHPASPGEQRLAAQLQQDPQLAPLFSFNQRVTTVQHSRYLVDLLWEEGRVVVEVDGYGYHSTRSAFASDRHRDYELTVSGYLVLRLPHDFVVQDPQLAVERIRDVVDFRIAHPLMQEAAR